ncbi:hypothetical protein ACQR0Z_12665 [Bradyrhizobium sp. HKCCYLS3077]|uniref:hypothetical protein n=1 Tax=Bradyrhizobium sp. HKCCYLS3077 TaxID=3420761 RepID=UPI003EB8D27D
MSISVKGRLAIVALIALACFASSVLKLYLSLLCISLLVSFAVVGAVAWLVERLPRQRHRSGDEQLARHLLSCQDRTPLPITPVDHTDAPSTAGHVP